MGGFKNQSIPQKQFMIVMFMIVSDNTVRRSIAKNRRSGDV